MINPRTAVSTTGQLGNTEYLWIQLACLDKKLVKTGYDTASMENCGLCVCDCGSLNSMLAMDWNGYLLPLLL